MCRRTYLAFLVVHCAIIVTNVQSVYGQAVAKAKITVTMLQVARPIPTKEKLKSLVRSTDVHVAVEIPGKFVVGTDLDGCTLESMTDNKNTNLLQLPDNAVPMPHIRETISTDIGNVACLAFTGPSRPAPGAGKVRIKGKLSFFVGNDERTIEKKDVSLKTGVELPVGTIKLRELTPATKKKGLGAATIYSPPNYAGTRPLKSVAATLEDGEVVVYILRKASALLRDKADYKYELTDSRAILGKRNSVDRCTLSVTYFDKVERIIVPVDLEVGLGF